MLVRPPEPGERILPRRGGGDVAAALMDVVANGTAKRASGAFVDADGKPLGDRRQDRHRRRTGRYSPRSKDREVSRSAAFAFFIGDRFFGVVTAHVPGDKASHYKFTSALPTQVLKVLAPALQPLITSPPRAARNAKVVAKVEQKSNRPFAD